MCKDSAPPAAKSLELAADPWAFWLILQSRFSSYPQPATGGRADGSWAGDGRKNQISFLAKWKKDPGQWSRDDELQKELEQRGLKVELASFYKEPSTIGTGSIFWDTGMWSKAPDSAEALLVKQVSDLNFLRGQFHRLKISRPVKPQLRDALAAISVPKDNARGLGEERHGGLNVVVGFVDNGCAFAHPNFIKKENDLYKSRVKRIWDQSFLPDHSEKWTNEKNFGYGIELKVDEYNLRTGRLIGEAKEGAELTEDELYAELGHRMIEDVVMDGMFGPADFTHGTHIMDIAVGANGVAPDADIVFVQLPQFAITENTDQASARHILDGVAYIFNYAAEVGKPAVVNISYNAYTGPHDGTSLLELGLDELLDERMDERLKTLGRAVVISAGNARDVNCHEFRTVPARQCLDGKDDDRQPLFWSVNPDDPTENFMEIWYGGEANLKVSVISPDGICVASAVGPNQYSYLRLDHSIMGAVIHRKDDQGNHNNQVLIALNPTAEMGVSNSGNSHEVWSPAASGIWRVEVCNQSNNPVSFHAWIERDDRGENPMVKQSHFLTSRSLAPGEVEDDEEFRKATPAERHTLGGFCTGEKTIVVGAYNLATGRPMPYSSLGPTVGDDPRPKPDIYAPGASDPTGNGIEAASAMSANLVRLSGTSVAAPFVAGLIARKFSDPNSGWLKLDTKGIIEQLKKDGKTIESPDEREADPYSIRIRN
jgi:subtilisin family serine protease